MELNDAVARQASQLEDEVEHLQVQLEAAEDAAVPADDMAQLLVHQAKRVRRASNLVVQQLAKQRDDLQAKEPQGND
jgi:hypothetical protein